MRGLVAARRSGRFGRTWWGRQFEDALEAPLVHSHHSTGERTRTVTKHPSITRGRALARHGAVLALEREGSTMAALVQGSQIEPFSATVTLAPYTADTLTALRAEIARTPAAAEEIIAGSLPEWLNSMAPVRSDDLRCDCTCPATEDRCPHILAMGYLLVERLDRDPELWWTLRNATLADLLTGADDSDEDSAEDKAAPLRDTSPLSSPVAPHSAATSSPTAASSPAVAARPTASPRPTPALDPQRFWHLGGPLPPLPNPLSAPTYHDLDRMQWMMTATSLTSDPIEKLQLENDINEAWDYLADSHEDDNA